MLFDYAGFVDVDVHLVRNVLPLGDRGIVDAHILALGGQGGRIAFFHDLHHVKQLVHVPGDYNVGVGVVVDAVFLVGAHVVMELIGTDDVVEVITSFLAKLDLVTDEQTDAKQGLTNGIALAGSGKPSRVSGCFIHGQDVVSDGQVGVVLLVANVGFDDGTGFMPGGRTFAGFAKQPHALVREEGGLAGIALGIDRQFLGVFARRAQTGDTEK